MPIFMFVIVIALAFGTAGFVAGGVAGALVGFLLHVLISRTALRRGEGARSGDVFSMGCGVILACILVGNALGCVAGITLGFIYGPRLLAGG